MYKRQVAYRAARRDTPLDLPPVPVVAHALALDGYADGIAVSYTHLRAHETVLDLVCRLLPETNTSLRTNLSDPLL